MGLKKFTLLHCVSWTPIWIKGTSITSESTDSE
jgi:hypothetical protein